VTRRFLGRLLLVFAMFYLFTHPVSAAALVNHAIGALTSATDSLAGFVTGLD
jgi:hypothetical protein